MPSLTASLSAAGQALGAYQQALEIIQNNVSNAATAGFAKASAKLEALPLDTAGGLAGGVALRGLDSARDEFAEEEVRRQTQLMGRFQAQAQATASIEKLFDVSGSGGIPGALNKLLQSFSAWSVTPASDSARQSVISCAGGLATAIRSVAEGLSRTASQVQTQIGSAVKEINRLAGAIRQYNVDRAGQESVDPAQDASLHSNLDQLSSLVDINVVGHADGTVTVLLGGGSPLVIGGEQYDISSTLAPLAGAGDPNASPSSSILDWQGSAITDQVTGGQLGGLLDARNRVIASLVGDGGQAGSLNDFAQSFADKVNALLVLGSTSSEAGAANGDPLFVYDATSPTRTALTFAVNPNLTLDALAPVDADGNSNGNAIQLAALGESASNGVNGMSFTGFLGEITAAVGRESAAAKDGNDAQAQVLTQSKALRDEASGVSLDEQAILLLQFQRSYQAIAKLLTTIDSLTESTLNLIRQ